MWLQRVSNFNIPGVAGATEVAQEEDEIKVSSEASVEGATTSRVTMLFCWEEDKLSSDLLVLIEFDLFEECCLKGCSRIVCANFNIPLPFAALAFLCGCNGDFSFLLLPLVDITRDQMRYWIIEKGC